MEAGKQEDRAIAATQAADVHRLLSTISASRIYFGHQSVGANVVEGLRELVGTADVPRLPIVRSRDVESISGPAFVEFTIGENGDGSSKILDFASVLEQARRTVSAIALFKYCYLDITSQTDVGRLFAAHRDAVRALQARRPELTFVHVTVPLTTAEPRSKHLLKRLLGKATSRDANRKRSDFNVRLRHEFTGEPIFDLARVESTRRDGSRSFVVANGDTVHTLAPELTDDGGHLNAAGRRAAALELLSVLSAAVSPNA
jgi:hypothetical protein